MKSSDRIVVVMLSGILFVSGWAYAQKTAPAQPVAAIDTKAESAKTLVSQGRDLLKAKKNQEALEAFQKAAELDPANDAAWDGQSDALHALKRPADADAVLEKWVQTQPKNPQAWTYKMMMAGMAGRHAEMLKACDKLIELDPDNGDHQMARGNALSCLGRNDEALTAFEKAATQSKNPIVRADAWRRRADIMAQQGKHDEAIKSYTKAIELAPSNASPGDVGVIWYGRAKVRTRTSDTANVLADLKKAIELRPECKHEAAKDAAFKSLQDNAEFKSLTK